MPIVEFSNGALSFHLPPNKNASISVSFTGPNVKHVSIARPDAPVVDIFGCEVGVQIHHLDPHFEPDSQEIHVTPMYSEEPCTGGVQYGQINVGPPGIIREVKGPDETTYHVHFPLDSGDRVEIVVSIDEEYAIKGCRKGCLPWLGLPIVGSLLLLLYKIFKKE